jgi:hypothetical protein
MLAHSAKNFECLSTPQRFEHQNSISLRKKVTRQTPVLKNETKFAVPLSMMAAPMNQVIFSKVVAQIAYKSTAP